MMERTELEKVALQSVTVTIGGREYNVRPLPFRPLIEWQRKRARVRAEAELRSATTNENERNYIIAREYLDADFISFLEPLVMDFLRPSLTEEEMAQVVEAAENGVRYQEDLIAAFEKLDGWVNPLKPLLTGIAEKMIAGALEMLAEANKSANSGTEAGDGATVVEVAPTAKAETLPD